MTTLASPSLSNYIAQQVRTGQIATFDEIIFCNIPNLNGDNLAEYLTMPNTSQIVYRQAVSQVGFVNSNAIVYSVTVGTEIGDFDFNYIGLINRQLNLLAVGVYTNTIKKIKNKNGIQGNAITRSILLEFTNAKQITNITIPAQTWQIDFTARLTGIDEKIRLTNRDLHGRAVFFEDGFLVKRKTGNQFSIQAGVAYIEGVRSSIATAQDITASLPCSIYIDVVHHCTVTGAYQTDIKFLKQHQTDYVDSAGHQHYVQILADIDSNGDITDQRINENGKYIKDNQKSDSVTSNSSYTVATSKAAKTAYDKAVEAKELAERAKASANNITVSPALTGTPTAPTASQATNNTQIATTEFVKRAIAALVGSAPETLDTLQELAEALGEDDDFKNKILAKINEVNSLIINDAEVYGGIPNDAFLAKKIEIQVDKGEETIEGILADVSKLEVALLSKKLCTQLHPRIAGSAVLIKKVALSKKARIALNRSNFTTDFARQAFVTLKNANLNSVGSVSSDFSNGIYKPSNPYSTHSQGEGRINFFLVGFRNMGKEGYMELSLTDGDVKLFASSEGKISTDLRVIDSSTAKRIFSESDGIFQRYIFFGGIRERIFWGYGLYSHLEMPYPNLWRKNHGWKEEENV